MKENTIIEGMPFKQYLKIERESYSVLKELDKSPAHYLHAKQNPFEPTEDQTFGSLSHAVLLEQPIDAEFFIYDEDKRPEPDKTFGSKLNKAWKVGQMEFAEKYDLRIVGKSAHVQCEEMAQSLLSNKDVSAILNVPNHFREAVVLWEHEGVKIKSRFDFLQDFILDYKTTKDASPGSFTRDSYDYRYHGQAGAYSYAYKAVYGKFPSAYYILAAEKKSPYHYALYKLDDEALESGRYLFNKWIKLLKACRENGNFPGYNIAAIGGAIDLTMPAWVR